MKKTRLLILTAVVLMALFIAALPLAAAGPFDPYPNWSFEYDFDGDGQPNWWNLRGNGAVYACTDNAHVILGDCVVGFVGSSRRAAIYQYLTYDQLNGAEEGVSLPVLQTSAYAKNLPAGRVLGGVIYHFDDFDFALYGSVRAGSYNFNPQLLWANGVGNQAYDIYYGGVAPNAFTLGFLAKAGSGQAFFDAISVIPYVPPTP